MRYTFSNIAGYGIKYVDITSDVNSFGGLSDVYAMTPFQGNQETCMPYLYSATSGSGHGYMFTILDSTQYQVILL